MQARIAAAIVALATLVFAVPTMASEPAPDRAAQAQAVASGLVAAFPADVDTARDQGALLLRGPEHLITEAVTSQGGEVKRYSISEDDLSLMSSPSGTLASFQEAALEAGATVLAANEDRPVMLFTGFGDAAAGLVQGRWTVLERIAQNSPALASLQAHGVADGLRCTLDSNMSLSPSSWWVGARKVGESLDGCRMGLLVTVPLWDPPMLVDRFLTESEDVITSYTDAAANCSDEAGDTCSQAAVENLRTVTHSASDALTAVLHSCEAEACHKVDLSDDFRNAGERVLRDVIQSAKIAIAEGSTSSDNTPLPAACELDDSSRQLALCLEALLAETKVMLSALNAARRNAPADSPATADTAAARCDAGEIGYPPLCLRPGDDQEPCRSGETGVPPVCVPEGGDEEPCPSGEIGYPPLCVRERNEQDPCASGDVGIPPYCTDPDAAPCMEFVGGLDQECAMARALVLQVLQRVNRLVADAEALIYGEDVGPASGGGLVDQETDTSDTEPDLSYPQQLGNPVTAMPAPKKKKSQGYLFAWMDDPADWEVAGAVAQVSFWYWSGCVHNPAWWNGWGDYDEGPTDWDQVSEDLNGTKQCEFIHSAYYARQKNWDFGNPAIPTTVKWERVNMQGTPKGTLTSWYNAVKSGEYHFLLHDEWHLVRQAPYYSCKGSECGIDE